MSHLSFWCLLYCFLWFDNVINKGRRLFAFLVFGLPKSTFNFKDREGKTFFWRGRSIRWKNMASLFDADTKQSFYDYVLGYFFHSFETFQKFYSKEGRKEACKHNSLKKQPIKSQRFFWKYFCALPLTTVNFWMKYECQFCILFFKIKSPMKWTKLQQTVS